MQTQDVTAKWNVPDEYAFNLDVAKTQVPNKYYLRKLVPNYAPNGLSNWDPIAVVGKGLSNPINHVDYFKTVKESFFNNMDKKELDSAQVSWKGSNNGAVLILDVRFPNTNQLFRLKSKENMVSWRKSLRTIIVRSLDGTFSNVALHGDIDWFCMNTLISGNFDSIKIRNSRSFSVHNFADKIEDVTYKFYKQCKIEQEYANAYVTDLSVQKLIKDIYPNTNEEDITSSEEVLKRKQQTIFDAYKLEAKDRGNTVYSVMSAFTRDSTHRPFRNTKQVSKWNTVNAKQHKRERQVQNILQSDVWKNFVHQKVGVVQ